MTVNQLVLESRLTVAGSRDERHLKHKLNTSSCLWTLLCLKRLPGTDDVGYRKNPLPSLFLLEYIKGFCHKSPRSGLVSAALDELAGFFYFFFYFIIILMFSGVVLNTVAIRLIVWTTYSNLLAM